MFDSHRQRLPPRGPILSPSLGLDRGGRHGLRRAEARWRIVGERRSVGETPPTQRLGANAGVRRACIVQARSPEAHATRAQSPEGDQGLVRGRDSTPEERTARSVIALATDRDHELDGAGGRRKRTDEVDEMPLLLVAPIESVGVTSWAIIRPGNPSASATRRARRATVGEIRMRISLLVASAS
jgi:hypothetical protein